MPIDPADSFWRQLSERLDAAHNPTATRFLLETMARAVPPPQTQPELTETILFHLFSEAPFLVRLLARDPQSVAWLTSPEAWRAKRGPDSFRAHLDEHLPDAGDDTRWMKAARRFRARELARIAARDLMRLASIESTMAELSELADVCLAAALAQAEWSLVDRFGSSAQSPPGDTNRLAIIALGKLGANELNFSSDVDLLFIYPNDEPAIAVNGRPPTNLEWAATAGQIVTRLVERQTEDGRLYRVDLRLRPNGASGSLAVSPNQCRSYYEKSGEPWERLALLRARFCAGNRLVGQQFLEVARKFVYRPNVEPHLVSSLREVKQQISAQLERKGRPGFDVKLGRGGIRELEFFVQTLQLLNAARFPTLREHRTLTVIDRLERTRLIDRRLRDSLSEDYCFLRKLEHRLQMVDDQQTHLLPRDPEQRSIVGQQMGFSQLAEFDDFLDGLREGIHLLFLSLFAVEEGAEDGAMRRNVATVVAETTPNLNPKIIQTVLAGWPVAHLRQCTIEDTAIGTKLLTEVNDRHPVAVDVRPVADDQLVVWLVGKDRTGLASVSTGVLAGAGMDIERGLLFTIPVLHPPDNPAGPRAMQYLRIRASNRRTLTDQDCQYLAADLSATARRWIRGETESVRTEINSRWVEHMRSRGLRFSGRIQPIDLEIDNRSDPRATIVSLWAEDAPGFLYGFTQALALRGINVHQIHIRTEGRRVIDRFHITDRHGRKIITLAARHEIEVIALLIKAFSHFLVRAADPARALVQFDALLDRLHQTGAAAQVDALATEPLLAALATVLGSGSHLFEDFLRLNPTHLLPVLESVCRGQPTPAPCLAPEGTSSERQQQLIAWRDAEIFRIDCEHLTDPSGDISSFSESLTRLAERVVSVAWDIAQEETAEAFGWPIGPDGSPVPWVVMALGKFGGRELGVASDLELMFVFGQNGKTVGPRPVTTAEFFERAMQAFRRSFPARPDGMFSLDLRLRPHGAHGPLATSVDMFERYYSPTGQAAAYERQALVRLVFCAGNTALAHRVLAARDQFTFGADPFPLADALQLRRRQIRELVHPDQVHLKLSPGGLVEVEYAIQYLQLQHGHTMPQLRSPNTLDALVALRNAGLIEAHDAERLLSAYETFRRVVDALRIKRGNARDLTLPHPEEPAAKILARRLNTDTPELFNDIVEQMRWTADFFRRMFGFVD